MSEQWYYAENGISAGPVNQDELARLVADGELIGDTYVWSKDLVDWTSLRDSPMRHLLNLVPTPLPPPLPNEPVVEPGCNSPTKPVSSSVRDKPSIAESDGPLLQPLSKLYKWVRASFIVYIASEALMAASAISMIVFFALIRRGAVQGNPELAKLGGQLDVFSQVAAVIFSLSLVISAILYLRFVHRAMSNLHAVKADGVDITPGWAVGWYFVPVAFLWKPLEAMRQVWKGSHASGDGKIVVPAAVGWWWVFWLTSNFLGQLSFRLSNQAGAFSGEIKDFALLESTFWVDLVGAICGVFSAVLLLWIVSRIAAAQRKLI